MKTLRKAMQAAEQRAAVESDPDAGRRMPSALRKCWIGLQTLFVLTTWGGLVALGWLHPRLAPAPAPPVLAFESMPIFASLNLSPAEEEATAPRTGEQAFEVLFDSGSDVLTHEAQRHLVEIAGILKASAAARRDLQIVGHADAVGAEPENLDLSRRRAEEVRRFLVEHAGLPPERLLVDGYGEARLRDDANPDSPLNRRVEIVTIERAL